jgi:hypothetical protein
MDELNEFIKIKDPANFGDLDIVTISNLVDQDGHLAFTTGGDNQTVHRIVITLVNVEEERTMKDQNYFKKSPDDNIQNLNPEIKINLHILFTAYSTTYETALLILGYVIGFFQTKNIFDKSNTPTLDGETDKIITELITLTYEQTNHLWGYLGAKYMPSVLYRFRMLRIQEDQKKAEGPPIQIINENLKDITG